MASPSPRETSATTCGVLPVRGGAHDGLARAARGPADLKMPEPTNTASAPSAIISAASAGVAMPPAAKFGTGSLPVSATSRTSS